MSELVIRPATIQDYAQLEKIYLLDRQQDFPWVQHPQRDDFERDSFHEYILVALLNDEPVGFLSFYRLANFIHLLFVDPDHQHQHVGSALIEHMRQLATGPMQLKVVVENQIARDFYQQLGFLEVKRDLLATPKNITLEDARLDCYPFITQSR